MSLKRGEAGGGSITFVFEKSTPKTEGERGEGSQEKKKGGGEITRLEFSFLHL